MRRKRKNGESPSGNPYLTRLAAEGLNAHGKKSEQVVATKLGARLHLNSGAMVQNKSDASMKKYRLEVKSTVTSVLPLDLAWLVKIAQEALDHGQTPAVVVSFVDSHGESRLRHYADWVVVPMAVFKELTET